MYTITLKTVKNRSAEYYLAYYSLFILALIEFSLTDPIDLTVLSLLLLVLGIVYIKNDLFFMNPTVNIFRAISMKSSTRHIKLLYQNLLSLR